MHYSTSTSSGHNRLEESFFNNNLFYWVTFICVLVVWFRQMVQSADQTPPTLNRNRRWFIISTVFAPILKQLWPADIIELNKNSDRTFYLLIYLLIYPLSLLILGIYCSLFSVFFCLFLFIFLLFFNLILILFDCNWEKTTEEEESELIHGWPQTAEAC